MCILLLSFVHGAYAFGEFGHQLIASIAQDLLTPEAKRQVQSILRAAGGGEEALDIVQISVWADKIRRLRPETASWHYVTLQLSETRYDPQRTKTPNVVTALEKSSAILSKKDVDRYVREEALKWVVHLVGDLHQPLHVGEDHDMGGNLVRVKVNRRSYSLHEVWDNVLVERLDLDVDSLQSILVHEIVADPTYLSRHRSGTVRDWVNATHAKTRICYSLHGKTMKKGLKLSLDKAYLDNATVLVLDQIKMAGIRLAVVLNSTLDPIGSKGPMVLSRPIREKSRHQPNGPGRPEHKFYWSANSKTYHFSNCADLARIKRKNLRKNDIPPPNLHLHANCPIRQ